MITRAVEQNATCEGEVAEGEKRFQQLLMEDASPALPVPACSPSWGVAAFDRRFDEGPRDVESQGGGGVGARMDPKYEGDPRQCARGEVGASRIAI